MKKLFLVAAITVLMGSLSAVFAAEETTSFAGETGTTRVTYELNQGYTITIPGEFALTPGSEIEKQVSASGAIIAEGKTLNVKISSSNFSNGEWHIKDANNSYSYELTKGQERTAIESGATILSVNAGTTEEVTESIFFSLDEDTVTKAGTYSDTLTFTVSVD